MFDVSIISLATPTWHPSIDSFWFHPPAIVSSDGIYFPLVIFCFSYLATTIYWSTTSKSTSPYPTSSLIIWSCMINWPVGIFIFSKFIIATAFWQVQLFYHQYNSFLWGLSLWFIQARRLVVCPYSIHHLLSFLVST